MRKRRILLGFLFFFCFQHDVFAATPAFKKLSPFRAGQYGSLKYAAKHFWKVFGRKARKFGHLHPIYPRMGFPALTTRNKTIRVEYMGDASALSTVQAGIKLVLVPRHLKKYNAKDKRVVVLTNVVLKKKKALTQFIFFYRLEATIPETAKDGFYDLVHFVPKRAKAKKQPTVKSSTTKPTKQGSSSSNVKSGYHSRRLQAAVSIMKEDPELTKQFHFVHLTDVHQRKKVGRRFDQIVTAINRLQPRPKFVLLTGDIVEYGRVKQLWVDSLKSLKRLDIPLFVVIGNHDYYRVHVGQPAQHPMYLLEEEGLLYFFRYYHPFLAFRFSYGGYKWLSVDTGSSATSRTWFKAQWVTTEGLGTGQLKDIDLFLKTKAKYGHVLFSHGTPRAHTRHYTDGCKPGRHGVFINGRTKLEKQLLASYKKNPRPIVLLHGHTHWNDIFGRAIRRRSCRFLRIKVAKRMMGKIPCFRSLPLKKRSPLLISTQSATKHQPLRSGGFHQVGMSFGEGSGAGFGFRLLEVNGKKWRSASYKFYYRTRFLARKHQDGYIDPKSFSINKLPVCRK